MVFKGLLNLGMFSWEVLTVYPWLAKSLITILVALIILFLVNYFRRADDSDYPVILRHQFDWSDKRQFGPISKSELEDNLDDNTNAGTPERDSRTQRPYNPVEYSCRLKFSEEEMLRRSAEYYELMNRRRTVRTFSEKRVPREVIENIIKTAGTSPSGAHQQPWTFVAIMNDKELKAEMRFIIESEERLNYERRMGKAWISALESINPEWSKPYLETVPCLLFVFLQTHGVNTDGTRTIHYYQQISASIAVGLLLTAIHNAGLVTVTSTPLNAGIAIHAALNRPVNEKLLVMLPIGYASDDVTVPDLQRKSLDKISVFL